MSGGGKKDSVKLVLTASANLGLVRVVMPLESDRLNCSTTFAGLNRAKLGVCEYAAFKGIIWIWGTIGDVLKQIEQRMKGLFRASL